MNKFDYFIGKSEFTTDDMIDVVLRFHADELKKPTTCIVRINPNDPDMVSEIGNTILYSIQFTYDRHLEKLADLKSVEQAQKL